MSQVMRTDIGYMCLSGIFGDEVSECWPGERPLSLFRREKILAIWRESHEILIQPGTRCCVQRNVADFLPYANDMQRSVSLAQMHLLTRQCTQYLSAQHCMEKQ